MSVQRPLALVTGASSGIGRELATLLAEEDYDLALVARREGELRQLADSVHQRCGIDSIVISIDLAQRASPQRVAERCQQDGRAPEVLINCSGFGALGSFADLPLVDQVEMVQVNVAALTELTRRFLPGMLARGSGRILNIASTAAFQPGPLMAVYYASKAYVLSFTEALAAELKGTGVTATVLCPGLVATGFQARAQMGSARINRFVPTLEAGAVAKVGYRAMMAGRAVVIPGTINKLLTTAVRFSPRAVTRAAVRKLMEGRSG